MSVQLYCNVDSEGKIVESISGTRILPEKQYDFFFFLTGEDSEEVRENIPHYRVINGELTLV